MRDCLDEGRLSKWSYGAGEGRVVYGSKLLVFSQDGRSSRGDLKAVMMDGEMDCDVSKLG